MQGSGGAYYHTVFCLWGKVVDKAVSWRRLHQDWPVIGGMHKKAALPAEHHTMPTGAATCVNVRCACKSVHVYHILHLCMLWKLTTRMAKKGISFRRQYDVAGGTSTTVVVSHNTSMIAHRAELLRGLHIIVD